MGMTQTVPHARAAVLGGEDGTAKANLETPARPAGVSTEMGDR